MRTTKRAVSIVCPAFETSRERLVGDVRGRHFTSVVAPEDSRRARELFYRKVFGTSAVTDATGYLVSTAGARWPWRSARYRS